MRAPDLGIVRDHGTTIFELPQNLSPFRLKSRIRNRAVPRDVLIDDSP